MSGPIQAPEAASHLAILILASLEANLCNDDV